MRKNPRSRMTRSILSQIGIGVLLLSCTPKTDKTQLSEFKRANLSPAETAQFAGLNYAFSLPVIQKSNLSKEQITFERQQIYGSKLYQSTIMLKELTATQIEALRVAYGSFSENRSKVIFEPGSSHSLTDFLPPVIQAMETLQFNPQQENVSTLATEVQRLTGVRVPSVLTTNSNCWGTVWEVLRHKKQVTNHSFAIFQTDTDMLSNLRDPTRSSRLSTLTLSEPAATSTAAIQKRNANLKPGDVLIITGGATDSTNETIIHAAIWLDFDLYFEKTGIDARTAYRVTTLAEILALYGGNSEEPRNLEWRRYDQNPVPHPATIFSARPKSLSSQDPYPHFITIADVDGKLYGSSILDVDYTFDSKTGRAFLSDDKFVQSTFFADKSCIKSCFSCTSEGSDRNGVPYSFEVPIASDAMSAVTIHLSKGGSGRRTAITPQSGLKLSKRQTGIWESDLNGKPLHFEFSSRTLKWRFSWGESLSMQGERCRYVR